MIWYGHKNGFVAEATSIYCAGGARHPVKLMMGGWPHNHNACVEEHDDESDIERMHCCPAQVFDLNQQRLFASLAERLHQQFGFVFPFSCRFIQPAWFLELPAGNLDDA